MLLPRRSIFYSRPNASIIPSLATIVVGFLFTFFIFYHDEIAWTWSTSTGVLSWMSASGGTQSSTPDLARDLIPLLKQYSPTAADSLDEAEKSRIERWTSIDQDDDQDLVRTLNVTARQTLVMKKAHMGFVEAIEDKSPVYHSASPEHAQGIVTVGGGSYFPPLLVSLRLLRRTGTTVPVEVFVPRREYEAELCERVLPALDATCRTFDHFDGRIAGYQYKVFAVLLSSFAEVLWLDADNFPLHDVAALFASAPFRATGLVTWPDLWQTSVAPAYYEIAGRPATSVSARASTEAGQLLVSKEKHWRTLLLAGYYNYYGPGYYYPLLCQGRAGAGDKETFLPAAEALNLSFYDVKTPTLGLGHFRNKTNPEEGLYRFALIQGDVVNDYERTMKLRETSKRDMIDAAENVVGSKDRGSDLADPVYGEVSPFFMHMMTPKCEYLSLSFRNTTESCGLI